MIYDLFWVALAVICVGQARKYLRDYRKYKFWIAWALFVWFIALSAISGGVFLFKLYEVLK